MVLLWVLGCFGTLIKGAIGGIIGALLGYGAGWLLSLKWPESRFLLTRWGCVMGPFCFACWPPRILRSSGESPAVRGRSQSRDNERDAQGFVMPVTNVSLPEPPPYKSDRVKMGIDQLQEELRRIAPKIDFGMPTIPDGVRVGNENEFYAADLAYVSGEFLDYLAKRMALEGIRQCTEAKFDCDDFAHYLNHCATLCIFKSGFKGATHTFFMASVPIKAGAQLLNVGGGASNAYHANNLVRCTDGNWYFVEPQAALTVTDATNNSVVLVLRRLDLADKIIRNAAVHANLNGNWICSAPEALGGRGVELLQARF